MWSRKDVLSAYPHTLKNKLYPNIVPLISPLAAPINMKYQK